jgi:hypothetical protein
VVGFAGKMDRNQNRSALTPPPIANFLDERAKGGVFAFGSSHIAVQARPPLTPWASRLILGAVSATMGVTLFAGRSRREHGATQRQPGRWSLQTVFTGGTFPVREPFFRKGPQIWAACAVRELVN